MAFVLFYVHNKRLDAIHDVLMEHEHITVSYTKQLYVCSALYYKIIVEVVESGMQRQLTCFFISSILLYNVVKTVKSRAVGPESFFA